MIRHVIMHIVVLTGLVLWGSCLHASAQITTQSESWGYTSSYSTANTAGTSYRQTMPASRGYTPACRSISAYNPDFKEALRLLMPCCQTTRLATAAYSVICVEAGATLTRMTRLASFRIPHLSANRLFCLLWHYCTPFSCFSVYTCSLARISNMVYHTM